MSLAIKSITNTQTETNKKLKVLNESAFLANAVEGTYVFHTRYSYAGGVDRFFYDITYPDNTTYNYSGPVISPMEDYSYCSEYAKYGVGASSVGYATTYEDTMTVVVGEDFNAQTVLTSNQHYHDIAKAIRKKNGESTTYLPSEMAEAISDLPDEPVLQSKSVTISSNTTQTITPDNNYDGLSSVSVTTNVQPNLQSKSVTISQNGTTNVSADSGYDGLSGVSITTNVSGGSISVKDTGVKFGYSSFSSIPAIFDFTGVTNFSYMLGSCSNLTSISQLDVSESTSFQYACMNCRALTTVSQLNTQNGTSFLGMFQVCPNLTTISQLDTSNGRNFQYMLNGCSGLTTLGGFKNLGQAYSTTQSANFSTYTLDLSSSTQLTHDSLMNVINNLYDIATKGCNQQKLVLGSTNLAKLTSAEIAIATNKGWAVS